MKFLECTTKMPKTPNLLNFGQHSPYFGPFPNSYYIQKTYTLRIKTRVHLLKENVTAVSHVGRKSEDDPKTKKNDVSVIL